MNGGAFDLSAEAEGLRQYYLTPGTLFCGAGPAVVGTVLGSCVAVCLIDRYNRAAGMNHFVLPGSPAGEQSLRYGDVANERLRERMVALGCSHGDLRAKLFGGAAVLPFGDPGDTIGMRNVALAMAWLHRHAIPVVARRTGGMQGMLVRFYTDTGRVLVRGIASGADRDPVRIMTEADPVVTHKDGEYV